MAFKQCMHLLEWPFRKWIVLLCVHYFCLKQHFWVINLTCSINKEFKMQSSCATRSTVYHLVLQNHCLRLIIHRTNGLGGDKLIMFSGVYGCPRLALQYCRNQKWSLKKTIDCVGLLRDWRYRSAFVKGSQFITRNRYDK